MNKLGKAIVKYGDIPIAALGCDEANCLSGLDDAWKIMDLRIMTNLQCLPGVPVEGNEPAQEDAFAVIFYDNRF